MEGIRERGRERENCASLEAIKITYKTMVRDVSCPTFSRLVCVCFSANDDDCDHHGPVVSLAMANEWSRNETHPFFHCARIDAML